MRTRFGRVLESLAFQGLLLATLIIVAAFFVIKPDIHGHFSDDTGSQAHEKPQHGEQDKVFFGLSPEGWTAVGTFGLFGATIALFVATYALFDTAARESDKAEEALEIARISAEASKVSSDIARETLIQSRRAWLKADISLLRLTKFFDDTQIRAEIQVKISNVGNAPAIYVNCIPTLFAVSALADPVTWRDIRCENIRKANLASGQTLFPNDTVTLNLGVDCGHEQIAHAIAYGARFEQTNSLTIRIVGCVNYRFASDSRFHQTRFHYFFRGFNASWISMDEIPLAGSNESLIVPTHFILGEPPLSGPVAD